MNRPKLVILIIAICLTASPAAWAFDLFSPNMMPNSLSVGLGPQYDYTSRFVAVENGGRMHFASNRALLEASFNPIGYVGVRAQLGAGDMLFSQPSNFDKIGSTRQAEIWRNGAGHFSAPFNFAGGGAIDIAPLRDPSNYIGLGITGFGFYQMGSREQTSVRLIEYGAAASIAYIGNRMIIPYVGLDYTGVYGSIKSTAGNGNNFDLRLGSNPDSPVGIFAGLSVGIGDHTRINIEGRFLNELSAGASLTYNF